MIVMQMKACQAAKDEDKDDINSQLLYYKSRWSTAEKGNIQLQKSMNKISGYLTNIGLTIEDLKEAWSTGVIKFGKINTNIFKIEWAWHKSKPSFKLNNKLKRISEESEVA